MSAEEITVRRDKVITGITVKYNETLDSTQGDAVHVSTPKTLELLPADISAETFTELDGKVKSIQGN